MRTQVDATPMLLDHVLRTVRQGLVLVAGSGLVAVGVVLLVLPGPGTPVLLAGLALLATEFTWAERLLASAKAGLNRLRPSRETVLRVATTLGACALIVASIAGVDELAGLIAT